MKFKIGDKVRIIATTMSQDSKLIGNIYTVESVFENDDTYRLNDPHQFIWSESDLELVKPKFDINMRKKFTKSDLKNGDFVKCRDGRIGVVISDFNKIVVNDDYCDIRIETLRPDLTSQVHTNADIIAIRRPLNTAQCSFDIFDGKASDLVYERKEVEEMTLKEVCEALGKEIKIVKEK